MIDGEDFKADSLMKPTALDYCHLIFEHFKNLPPYVKINILSQASFIDLGQRLIAPVAIPTAPDNAVDINKNRKG
jgi:hypothetical protein